MRSISSNINCWFTRRQSTVAIEQYAEYEGLIRDTKEDLAFRLENIDNKTEQLATQNVTQSESDTAELSSLKEERLGAEKCLQICAQLSSHIDQIQLISDRASPSQGANASLEAVINEGTQEGQPIWKAAAATYAVTTFVMPAFQSSVMLYQTVQNFQSRFKALRELLQELDALKGVLQVLKDSIGPLDFDLTSLELPLMRCNNACREFDALIKRNISHSIEGQISTRDWLRLRYLGGDISDFTNMLAGYKSTISIALALTNL